MIDFWQQITPDGWHAASIHEQSYGLFGFVLVFSVVVYLGTQIVDYVNRLLMMGLMPLLLLVVFSVPQMDAQHLFGSPRYLIVSVPVIVASFTSHLILPTLRTYLKMILY